MTEEQESLMKDFETRVRQCLMLCRSLQEENASLRQALEKERETGKDLELRLRGITMRYEKLKMAKSLSAEDGELTSAKTRLTKLIRDVESCIALVNDIR